MKLMIHADRENKNAAGLENQIQDRLPDIHIFRSRTLGDLAGNLGQPMNNISVIIIFAPTLEVLNDLFPLKSFFDNKKLILVLPDQGNQAFIRGLQLNPSFIGRSAEHGEDVLMVLDRINERQQTMTQISQHLNTYK